MVVFLCEPADEFRFHPGLVDVLYPCLVNPASVPDFAAKLSFLPHPFCAAGLACRLISELDIFPDVSNSIHTLFD